MDLFLLSVIKRIFNNKVTKLIPSPYIYRKNNINLKLKENSYILKLIK